MYKEIITLPEIQPNELLSCRRGNETNDAINRRAGKEEKHMLV
jgi:hypothetical protein